MSLISLTNLPTRASKLPIESQVKGEQILIVTREGEHSLRMTDTWIGDHMFSKPDDLRRMVGDDIATAIKLARDAGYQQALYDVRKTLGIRD